MKYLTHLLLVVLFFSFSCSTLNSQIRNSEYVREEAIEGEVLGIEAENSELLEEEGYSLKGSLLLDILAVSGGVVIIALSAYMVYSKKET